MEQVLNFDIDCSSLDTPDGLNARTALERLLVGQQVQLKRRTQNGDARARESLRKRRNVARLMVRAGISPASDGNGEYEDCRPIPWPLRR
jgi:endonuclease YncB( thermonuclease family)